MDDYDDDRANDGMIISGGITSVLPDARTIIMALCAAMVQPERFAWQPSLTRPPHRLLQLLIAYRSKDAYPEIQAAMSEFGIAILLESKDMAMQSAAQYGTQYKGKNVETACDMCGISVAALSKCSNCGKA